jgi:hypothetical protein
VRNSCDILGAVVVAFRFHFGRPSFGAHSLGTPCMNDSLGV